jgi:uncharacterized protein YdeI (YjbR/CyaY-like superfamily)
MELTKNVDNYFSKHGEHILLLNKLISILQKTSLDETVKWGMSTYTLKNKNLAGIGAFKNHVVLWFFQGGLLKDKYNKLTNAQEGKTKAMRQMRFKKLNDVNEKIILEYISESIENQNSGLVIKPIRKTEEIIIPDELLAVFKKNSKLDDSFNGLTPGKIRDYIEYINSAKRASTKLSSREKIIPLILSNKGLYDKYKNC